MGPTGRRGISAGRAEAGWLRAWGTNSYGECDAPAGSDFVAISAGWGYGLALKADGSRAAWGDHRFGQLDVPVENQFVAIAAGATHNLAIEVPEPSTTVGLLGVGTIAVLMARRRRRA